MLGTRQVDQAKTRDDGVSTLSTASNINTKRINIASFLHTLFEYKNQTIWNSFRTQKSSILHHTQTPLHGLYPRAATNPPKMSTMSLIEAHLESISFCSTSIASLTFPRPKIFTNALLLPHDITTLIRDTEAHERALFSVPPPAPPKAVDPSASTSNRRTTTFGGNGGNGAVSANAMRAPRRNTAVAAVLGGDLVERIRRGGGGGAGSGLGYQSYERGREKGEVDVDVLLEGAEKLCGV
jgi:hypothetical protein